MGVWGMISSQIGCWEKWAMAGRLIFKVGDLWRIHDWVVSWNLIWRRQPCHWEVNLIENPVAIIERVNVGGVDDVWLWTPEEKGIFLCTLRIGRWRSYYYLTKVWMRVKNWVFGEVWKRPAPSKVIVFSWSLLLDRIPTRLNLAFRHALDPGASRLCVSCRDREETATHLFLHCEATS